MKFKPNPIQKAAIVLEIMTVMALVQNPTPDAFLNLGLTLGVALILYWLYTRFSSKHKVIENTVVTGLILFLLVHPMPPSLELWPVVLATFVAVSLKFFAEFKGSPIVNPAAVALLGGAILANLAGNDTFLISWWGASFAGKISFIPLVIWALWGVHSWRKWPLVLSFLAAFAASLYLFQVKADIDFIRFVFTDSTIYFFATIMLIEPKSSPIRMREQIVYGIGVGFLATLFNKIQLEHFILHALIAGNLLYYFKTLPLRYTAKSR